VSLRQGPAGHLLSAFGPGCAEARAGCASPRVQPPCAASHALSHRFGATSRH
jgi:hypothetical protein